MFKNIFWDVLARLGGQVIAFIVSIVLTRLVTPEEYGVMGMALAIGGFANVFLDAGFRNAIVQSQTVTQRQYSSVFYTNLGIALGLGAVCFLSADFLSHFLHHPKIKPVCQLLSLNFILSGLNVVPGAILYKRMAFRVSAVIALIAAFCSGLTGILMAINGYGVWSLVWQLLVNSLVVTVLNWLYARWRPALTFSAQELKPLWQYGSRLFTASLLEVIFTRADVFFIGRMFSPTMLGYYGRAQGMDNIVRQLSAGSLMNVLFPYIAKNQDDKEMLAVIFVRFLHIIMFVSIGMSFALYLIARPLFAILFTERWDSAAQIFQVLSLAGFAWPVSSLMCALLSAVGNSKAFLRAEIYKKAVFVVVYIAGLGLGLMSFIWLLMAGYYIAVLINAWYVAAEIDVSVRRQMAVVLQYLVLGLLSLALSLAIAPFIPGYWSWLPAVVSTLLFCCTYYSLVVILKLPGKEFIHLARQKIRKR